MRSRLAHPLRNALTAAFLFSCSAPCALADGESTAPGAVIPLSVSSPEAAPATAEIEAALKGLKASAEKGKTELKPFTPYVLYGDLFGTRDRYALAALDGMVGFALWSGGKWELKGLWKVANVWGDLPNRPLPHPASGRPFWVEELSGDKTNEVVVAGGVAKYFQNFHLFRFNAGSRQLEWVADSMDRPEFSRGYLKLHSRAPRFPVWSEFRFFRWRKGGLVPVADWRSETPEVRNPTEKPSWKATVYSSKGVKEDEFLITHGASAGDRETFYVVARNGAPFSNLVIRWKAEPEPHTDLAFLFERLTWIPRTLYPEANKDLPANVTLEKLADIIVTGNPLKR